MSNPHLQIARAPVRGLAIVCAFAISITATSATAAPAEEYRPGDAVEYRVRTGEHDQWEPGTILRAVDGGSSVQYLVRKRPTPFEKEPQAAYFPADLRRPPANPAPANPTKPDAPVTPPPAPQPAAPGNPAPANPARADGKGPMTREEVLAFARQVFGGADREANQRHPRRDELVARIRDEIKARGANFKVSATDEFYAALNAQGTGAPHISFAINDNFGPHPRLEDYFGTWHLRQANRGSRTVKPDGVGGQKVVITTDEQHESGRLTINKDGTYEWALLRGDPPEKWLRGRWHAAAPDEMNPTEGGPAIWLEKAKGGYDSMVRMNREEGWTDWIDVGWGKARTPVEYGRRPAAP